MAEFKDRFKELRTEKGVTQADIAKLLNVKHQTVSFYETGREPNYKSLSKLADYFDVSVDYLIGHTDLKRYEDKNMQEIVLGNDSARLPCQQINSYMKIQDNCTNFLREIFKFLESIKDDKIVEAVSEQISLFFKFSCDDMIVPRELLELKTIDNYDIIYYLDVLSQADYKMLYIHHISFIIVNYILDKLTELSEKDLKYIKERIEMYNPVIDKRL
jgi:transcriptional regulator with XRE-family HTH domain